MQNLQKTKEYTAIILPKNQQRLTTVATSEEASSTTTTTTTSLQRRQLLNVYKSNNVDDVCVDVTPINETNLQALMKQSKTITAIAHCAEAKSYCALLANRAKMKLTTTTTTTAGMRKSRSTPVFKVEDVDSCAAECNETSNQINKNNNTSNNYVDETVSCGSMDNKREQHTRQHNYGGCSVADAQSATIKQQQQQQQQQQCDIDPNLRFGCAHYKRRAMFVTPCCNKFYKCRFCHDENESHHFDRKTLTELICSECKMRQKVQEQCEYCGTRFGKYTCLVCNLFDDTDKQQYHCNECGICRIGGAENFFHCKRCDMCLPIELQIHGHRCVENVSRSHCPVCLGDIHTSRIPCHIPDCGHLLHKMCFDQLLTSGHYTCPTCQTSLIDMSALWDFLDAQALLTPMPKHFENQSINIFCNDCHKTTITKFHFIGLKCLSCGAYNTTQEVKRRISLVRDEANSA